MVTEYGLYWRFLHLALMDISGRMYGNMTENCWFLFTWQFCTGIWDIAGLLVHHFYFLYTALNKICTIFTQNVVHWWQTFSTYNYFSLMYLLKVQILEWEVYFNNSSCLNSCPQNILFCRLVFFRPQSVEIIQETE